MFRIAEDPSSGGVVQCLAEKYKNDSIVSFNMDNMADTRFCETVAKQDSLTWGKLITVYGPRNDFHCLKNSCTLYSLYSIYTVNVMCCCAAEHVAAASV
jgi:hypothetical protein